jgi:hypothetical protein
MNPMQQLRILAKSGKYLFHGTGNEIKIFEPMQAYNYKNGKRIKDGKPAVHATHLPQVASFMALITKNNFPEHFNCGYFWSDRKIHFWADNKTLNKIKGLKSMTGYVYILNKDKFQRRNKIEWVSFVRIKPYRKIKIDKESLPVRIAVKSNP